jgi:para-nitrobenzyl esterase
VTPGRPTDRTTAVETSQGRIVGTDAEGVRVFRGVPFAAPLTSDRRFLPPEPPPRQNTIDATHFGPPAPQNPDPLDPLWGEVLAPGAEDCLTLNVYAPPLDPAGPRPVLVWVHGGAFIIGSGRWPWYEGIRFARRTSLVLVTLNYRLGVFGFLDLSEIGGKEFATSGNLGLLDQVRALEWVREHIAAFGGDPGNVTLCGQSAGGISVSCLLACPRAAGLFHKAVAMSGGPNLVRDQGFARDVARRVLHAAGAESVADLRRLPVRRLLKAQRTVLSATDFGDPLFGPVVDGEVLPEPPLHRVRAGSAAGVPLLAGSTRDEFRLWGLYVPILRRLPPEALVPWLGRLVGGRRRARDLIATYRRTRPGATPGEVTFAILGDVLFTLPVLRLAEAQAAHRSDTRVYRFDWPSPAQGGWLGAAHSVEVSLLFGNLAGVSPPFVGSGPEQEALSDLLQDTWAAFARTGVPTHPGLPPWPAYNLDERWTMLLDTTCRVEPDPHAPERQTWEGVPFDGIHPTVTELPRRRELTAFLIIRLVRRMSVLALALLLLALSVLMLAR